MTNYQLSITNWAALSSFPAHTVIPAKAGIHTLPSHPELAPPPHPVILIPIPTVIPAKAGIHPRLHTRN